MKVLKDILTSFITAITTYSRIPLPYLDLKDSKPRYLFVFFPLVGAVIAAFEYLWLGFVSYRGLQGSFLAGAVCTAIPLLITGGIHMDGFLDCVDAFSSYREKEERLKILKDPHVGAFAVIWTIVYMLIYVSSVWSILQKNEPYLIRFMLIIPIYERILTGLSVLLSKMAREDGMLSYMIKDVSKTVTGAVLFAEFLSLFYWTFYMAYTDGISLMIPAVIFGMILIVCIICVRRSHKTLGGITGDTCGYTLQIMELTGLFVIAMM